MNEQQRGCCKNATLSEYVQGRHTSFKKQISTQVHSWRESHDVNDNNNCNKIHYIIMDSHGYGWSIHQ